MLRRWIIPLVVLPGSVLGLVPFVLGVILRDTAHAFVPAPTGSRAFFFAIALAGPGLLLAAGSMSLFFRFGDGTAAPWDPPAKLVVRGLYRHVRNPMLTGVFFLIAAEASFFQSLPLAVWLVLFIAGNCIYFPFVEEPALLKRFGEEYRAYRQHVPRWIPRLTPWRPPRR